MLLMWNLKCTYFCTVYITTLSEPWWVCYLNKPLTSDCLYKSRWQSLGCTLVQYPCCLATEEPSSLCWKTGERDGEKREPSPVLLYRSALLWWLSVKFLFQMSVAQFSFSAVRLVLSRTRAGKGSPHWEGTFSTTGPDTVQRDIQHPGVWEGASWQTGSKRNSSTEECSPAFFIVYFSNLVVIIIHDQLPPLGNL